MGISWLGWLAALLISFALTDAIAAGQPVRAGAFTMLAALALAGHTDVRLALEQLRRDEAAITARIGRRARAGATRGALARDRLNVWRLGHATTRARVVRRRLSLVVGVGLVPPLGLLWSGAPALEIAASSALAAVTIGLAASWIWVVYAYAGDPEPTRHPGSTALPPMVAMVTGLVLLVLASALVFAVSSAERISLADGLSILGVSTVAASACVAFESLLTMPGLERLEAAIRRTTNQLARLPLQGLSRLATVAALVGFALAAGACASSFSSGEAIPPVVATLLLVGVTCAQLAMVTRTATELRSPSYELMAPQALSSSLAHSDVRARVLLTALGLLLAGSAFQIGGILLA